MKRYRIVSDGTPAGTHVFYGDEELVVATVTWHISATQCAMATLQVDLTDADVDIAADEESVAVVPLPRP